MIGGPVQQPGEASEIDSKVGVNEEVIGARQRIDGQDRRRRLQQQPAFDFCDEPPAPTMTFNMGTDEYTLIGFRCCCLAPAVAAAWKNHW